VLHTVTGRCGIATFDDRRRQLRSRTATRSTNDVRNRDWKGSASCWHRSRPTRGTSLVGLSVENGPSRMQRPTIKKHRGQNPADCGDGRHLKLAHHEVTHLAMPAFNQFTSGLFKITFQVCWFGIFVEWMPSLYKVSHAARARSYRLTCICNII